MSLLKANSLSLNCLQQLAAADGSAEKLVVELLTTLQDSDQEIRAWACDALQTIEVPPSESAACLAEFCKDSHVAVVAWACKLLARLGAGATEYQFAIADVLDTHPEISARQQAALSLSAIPGLNPESLAALERAAASDDPRLKRIATVGLAQLASSRGPTTDE